MYSNLLTAAGLSATLLSQLAGAQSIATPVVPTVTLHPTAQESAEAANLEHYWAYGRSPPVYPSPEGTGEGPWQAAYSRARGIVAQMTNDEKNNITYGFASTSNGCSGVSGSAPRLGFPGLCLQDAGNGVRGTDGVNGYPGGLSVGASWNKSLTLLRAQHIGAEFKKKGANVALGPVVGPLGRVAKGGRNWEGFSNDPYLAGSLVYETVVGMQEHTIACVKHLIGNEQETNRKPPVGYLVNAFNVSVSSNIDDQTIHELYLWPFQEAVRAGAGSVMCSYNNINGSYACQNSKSINGLLKEELGFQGFVVSDWRAQHTGIASAEAGLDLAMPNSPYWQDGNLTLAVTNGSLSQSRLDDMATRILASYYRYAEYEPGSGIAHSLFAPHELVDARDPASQEVLLAGAIEGHVLVKNLNNTLPLKKPKFISLFGYDATAALVNTKTSSTLGKWDTGLENVGVIPGVGDFNESYLLQLFQNVLPFGVPLPGVGLNGTSISGGGSGAITPGVIDAPFNAIERQAAADNTYLAWDFVDLDPPVNQASEVSIVFVNEVASEGWDRPYLADPDSDSLIESVARQSSNTIVVIHNPGVRLVDQWIDNPNITAVLYAHTPGPRTGQALVDVLYGAVSPSGRLPYTVAKAESDYGQLADPTTADNTSQWHTQSNFTEGVYIDYKHFIAQNITPRYEFGFGLTYSSFAYSGLQVQTTGGRQGGGASRSHPHAPAYGHGHGSSNSSAQPEGGDPALFETIATVTANIKNTGSVAAAEVAQLYVHIPGGPERVLRGFEKTYLQPGQEVKVSFPLRRKDLSLWDVVSQAWVLPSGGYEVFVGKSVLDIQLKGTLAV